MPLKLTSKVFNKNKLFLAQLSPNGFILDLVIIKVQLGSI